MNFQPPRSDRPLPPDLFWDPGWATDPAPPWLFKDLDPAILVEVRRIVIDYQIANLRNRADAYESLGKIVAER
ncbi:MAG TPA: hypothetical protein VFJ61_01135 [Solirubrobacterales bacterium]|nr:hypothetical protein [Solirubrobacterales bacterium]